MDLIYQVAIRWFITSNQTNAQRAELLFGETAGLLAHHRSSVRDKPMKWSGATPGCQTQQAGAQPLRGAHTSCFSPRREQVQREKLLQGCEGRAQPWYSNVPDLISRWECSSLANSSTLVWCSPCCCLTQITSYWRQGAAKCSAAHLRRARQAVRSDTQQRK